MTKKLEIYKCKACGNIVEMVHGGAGELVCCNVPMELLDEKTADAVTEKHVPVVEKIDSGYKVVVGSTRHPMEEDHFIEWIELIAGEKTVRQFLQPGGEPETVFGGVEGGSVTVREHCNKHGLWKA